MTKWPRWTRRQNLSTGLIEIHPQQINKGLRNSECWCKCSDFEAKGCLVGSKWGPGSSLFLILELGAQSTSLMATAEMSKTLWHPPGHFHTSSLLLLPSWKPCPAWASMAPAFLVESCRMRYHPLMTLEMKVIHELTSSLPPLLPFVPGPSRMLPSYISYTTLCPAWHITEEKTLEPIFIRALLQNVTGW